MGRKQSKRSFVLDFCAGEFIVEGKKRELSDLCADSLLRASVAQANAHDAPQINKPEKGRIRRGVGPKTRVWER